jgi:hypothetical protein
MFPVTRDAEDKFCLGCRQPVAHLRFTRIHKAVERSALPWELSGIRTRSGGDLGFDFGPPTVYKADKRAGER